jgi:hypothetical protein
MPSRFRMVERRTQFPIQNLNPNSELLKQKSRRANSPADTNLGHFNRLRCWCWSWSWSWCRSWRGERAAQVGQHEVSGLIAGICGYERAVAARRDVVMGNASQTFSWRDRHCLCDQVPAAVELRSEILTGASRLVVDEMPLAGSIAHSAECVFKGSRLQFRLNARAAGQLCPFVMQNSS